MAAKYRRACKRRWEKLLKIEIVSHICLIFPVDVERMILGNKCDMTDKRVVNKERGEAVSFLTSPKSPPSNLPHPLDCSRIRNPFHGNISQSQHQHWKSFLRVSWSDSRSNRRKRRKFFGQPTVDGDDRSEKRWQVAGQRLLLSLNHQNQIDILSLFH